MLTGPAIDHDVVRWQDADAEPADWSSLPGTALEVRVHFLPFALSSACDVCIVPMSSWRVWQKADSPCKPVCHIPALPSVHSFLDAGRPLALAVMHPPHPCATPAAIAQIICEQLRHRDLLNLRLVCKGWREPASLQVSVHKRPHRHPLLKSAQICGMCPRWYEPHKYRLMCSPLSVHFKHGFTRTLCSLTTLFLFSPLSFLFPTLLLQLRCVDVPLKTAAHQLPQLCRSISQVGAQYVC